MSDKPFMKTAIQE